MFGGFYDALPAEAGPAQERNLMWEPGLPAMNDDALNLLNRGGPIAGKPRSHTIYAIP